MENPKVGIGVLIFNHEGKILLGQRKSEHGTGSWGPPGGHLEAGESFEACARRETEEEAGIELENPTYLAITNDVFKDKHYVSIFITATSEGIPEVKEPDKMVKWDWFPLENLPSPLFLPLQNLIDGKQYGPSLKPQPRPVFSCTL